MEIIGLTDKAFVHNKIRKRPDDMHKGQCGKVLIAAGQHMMAGAAIFALRSALRSGSGLVYGLCTSEIVPIIQTSVPEAICTLWDASKVDMTKYDAICVGPGMGVGSRTEEILVCALTQSQKPVLIDADGLNTVAASCELQTIIKNRNYPVIITPHIGEASRLLGNLDLSNYSKLEIGERLHDLYGCISVVKGHETLVAVSEEKAYINTTGNPGMATAGSGDVLSGIITSLAGQGYVADDAARLGVYIHGLAGDIAREKVGEYGLIASDIIENLPIAFMKLAE